MDEAIVQGCRKHVPLKDAHNVFYVYVASKLLLVTALIQQLVFLFLFDFNKNCVYLLPFSKYSRLFVKSHRL